MLEQKALFDMVCLFALESKLRVRMFAAAGVLLFLSPAGRGQTVTATIPVGKNPVAIAVNPVTNKIYVANCPDRSSINGSLGQTIPHYQNNGFGDLP